MWVGTPKDSMCKDQGGRTRDEFGEQLVAQGD